jgi:hypothetical protein
MVMGRIVGRLAGAALSVAVAVLLSGCGKGKGLVTGKVTVDDRPVRSGELTFVSSDGTKYPTAIGFDGRYSIELPTGDYNVGVGSGSGPSAVMMKGMKGMKGAPMTTPPTAPKGLPAMKDPTGEVKGEGVDMAKEAKKPVVIPLRYRPPESSGFKVTVTGSGDTLDIPMKSKG